MQPGKKVLLGSGSPRRQMLLRELGIEFRVLKSDSEETFPANLPEDAIAEFLAKQKGRSLTGELKSREILLTADTDVWLNGIMLRKPLNSGEAIDMLRKLSGKTHQVYTGVFLTDKERTESFHVRSDVTFLKLSEEDIRNYVERFQPFDKAGSYGAQESLPEGMNPCSPEELDFLRENRLNDIFGRSLGKQRDDKIPLIAGIRGGFFNVMGLPIAEVARALMRFNLTD